MKVLLDENLDHALRRLLGPHDVVTVNYMGWAGLQNGALLRAAEDGGIDVLLTGDQTLKDEQSLMGRRLAVVARLRFSCLSSEKTCQRSSLPSTVPRPGLSTGWTAANSAGGDRFQAAKGGRSVFLKATGCLIDFSRGGSSLWR